MRALSPRQKQIVDLMGLGLPNKEIAFRLGLATRTVQTYASIIYQIVPEMGRRYGAVRIQVREHEKAMALRLSEWIKRHGETLGVDALAEIKGIMADQVADILNRRNP